jgi:hypothetical protein
MADLVVLELRGKKCFVLKQNLQTFTKKCYIVENTLTYFHGGTLWIFLKIAEIQAQATKLLLTIQDIPSAQLYESAVAPDISAQRLKRFNTTKVKKGALVVSA